MAKKASRSTALAIKHALARGRQTVTPLVIRTPTPVVKVKKTKTKHHKGGHRGGNGDIFSHKRTALMIGAFAVGVLEKQGIMTNLPALPFIGRTGTIGIAAHMFSGGRAGLADDISTAALVIAAHELGSTGSIIGGGEAEWETSGAQYVDAY